MAKKKTKRKTKLKKPEIFWANQGFTIGLLSEKNYKLEIKRNKFEMQMVSICDLFRNDMFVAWKTWGYSVDLFEQACKIVESLGSLPQEVFLPVNKRGPMFFEIYCGKKESERRYRKIYLALAETIIGTDKKPKETLHLYGG